MKRAIGTLVLSLVVLSAAATAEAQSTSNFEKAGRALACPGAPSVKKINLNRHEFNANSKMKKVSGRVYGKFNHHLTARPDDDIKFSFIEGNDSWSSIRIEVNNGGFFGWVDDLVDSTIGSLGGLIDVQADEVLTPQIADMASDLVGRPWRDQAVGLAMVARAMWENERLGFDDVCGGGGLGGGGGGVGGGGGGGARECCEFRDDGTGTCRLFKPPNGQCQ